MSDLSAKIQAAMDANKTAEGANKALMEEAKKLAEANEAAKAAGGAAVVQPPTAGAADALAKLEDAAKKARAEADAAAAAAAAAGITDPNAKADADKEAARLEEVAKTAEKAFNDAKATSSPLLGGGSGRRPNRKQMGGNRKTPKKVKKAQKKSRKNRK